MLSGAVAVDGDLITVVGRNGLPSAFRGGFRVEAELLTRSLDKGLGGASSP